MNSCSPTNLCFRRHSANRSGLRVGRLPLPDPPATLRPPLVRENRECYYCHEAGHVIAKCPRLEQKNQKQKKGQIKPVGLVRAVTPAPDVPLVGTEASSFEPYIIEGSVALSPLDHCHRPVRILRDTGAAQSFMLASVVPLSADTSCGSEVLVQGIDLSILRAPLHKIYLRSALVTGTVTVAICPHLPVSNVSFILGNDLVGISRGSCLPEVVSAPEPSDLLGEEFPTVFPACVLTRAQARRYAEVENLSDSFLCSEHPIAEGLDPATADAVPTSAPGCDVDISLSPTLSREELVLAQKQDSSLAQYAKNVVNTEELSSRSVGYFYDDGVLMRKWTPKRSDSESDWSTVFQVVVPKPYREHVLSLAHDQVMSGHLGVRKTYQRLLQYFFWPLMKSDVTRYCRSCHVCQLAGKPNQTIPSAPLKPIPAYGEPFEKVLIDCVGPLPKTKTGYTYLLTIMCTATRYPEAIPLRSLKTPAIVRALIKFFTTFGLPKVVQSDQGSNFMSAVFRRAMKQLHIQHNTSSAYHPESQGAIERFHQTLKSMLRIYCLSHDKDWDEGLPFLLFAVRTTPQESLGFSSAELIFGHALRGPLKILQEEMLSDTPPSSPPTNVLDYVSSFRERLHSVCALAQESLSATQTRMKSRHDQKAVLRSLDVGDKVLVLLPVPGSALCAKFVGPYEVLSRLSDTDYVIRTPDRRKKTRVCHVNMLKRYVSRADSHTPAVSTPVPALLMTSVSAPSTAYVPENDGLSFGSLCPPVARLPNSEALAVLPTKLDHLHETARQELLDLVREYADIFSDALSRTTVIEHDIDVGDHTPVRSAAYRVNPEKRALMKTEADYLLENVLAVPSSSPWCSPCLLVPKPDATFRFCTDFRRVNALTKADSFPIPRIDDCVDRVGHAQFVTKLDLLKGYWQVPLTDRASEISAFATPDTFLQYTVMPFGLKNAPATFQRLMRIVLNDLNDCDAYLDDVVVSSASWPEHLSTLANVFERFRQARLTLNLDKCEFGRATVVYLGKQVGNGRVRPVDSKVRAIVAFPTPTTLRELRRFLGMTGYYRSFCRNFANVVLPLTTLLRKDVPFVWTSDCQAAFDAAKALLCSSPVLMAPQYNKPFKLDVDASDSGCGAVLLQEDDAHLDHPVAYFSAKFNRHQVHYSTIEKEALALLLALQHFEIYVTSSPIPVAVYTDHNPLVFLHRMSNKNQRLMRWSLLCQSFNLNIVHKKGSENVVADCLSRS
ncbi:uncharacterized protein LOC143525877 [Brachyhypopomus gauderio]|uniref:uncharacterized protein LOC143525877 n=1 Tax=Brachyhypopomus gauderio TaxID=698409 RepID=UPI00404175E7